MRTRLFVLLLIAVAAITTVAFAADRNFVTPLSGDSEVPPVTTDAHGVAIFQLNSDATELSYKLIVANIENVVGAHIHMGAANENGPVVAVLYGPAAPGGGGVQGVLAQGTLTAADLVGPLAGSASLAPLLDLFASGDAYVNVHTNDGVDPPGSGPGDYPSGEIRGQITPRGNTAQ